MKVDKNRALAGLGLLGFGGASIYANISSVHLPHLEGEPWRWSPEGIAAWQAMGTQDATGGDIFWAILFPLAALAGIEFVSRWTSLRKGIRYGVLGLAAGVAAFASYKHIVYVLLWHGQGTVISIVGPFAVDALMILCTMQLLSSAPVEEDKPAPVVVQRTVGHIFPVVPFGFTPAYHLSPVSIGCVPPPVVQDTPRVPKARVSKDRDVDMSQRVRMSYAGPVPIVPEDKPAGRGTWDRAEAARLIMSCPDMSNQQIGEAVGISYKQIQRLRREIKESEAMSGDRA